MKEIDYLEYRVKIKTRIIDAGLSGAKRDRTADLLNAIQALSQLSYSPQT